MTSPHADRSITFPVIVPLPAPLISVVRHRVVKVAVLDEKTRAAKAIERDEVADGERELAIERDFVVVPVRVCGQTHRVTPLDQSRILHGLDLRHVGRSLRLDCLVVIECERLTRAEFAEISLADDVPMRIEFVPHDTEMAVQIDEDRRSFQ